MPFLKLLVVKRFRKIQNCTNKFFKSYLRVIIHNDRKDVKNSCISYCISLLYDLHWKACVFVFRTKYILNLHWSKMT